MSKNNLTHKFDGELMNTMPDEILDAGPVVSEPEAGIMAEVAAGNISAFRGIVDCHQKPLINFISKYIVDKSAVEDVAQEVFLRVFRAAGDYRPKAKFKTWLFTIAANYCLNEIRSRSRRPFLDFTGLNEAGFIAVAPDSCSPLKLLENKELGAAILKAVSRLPEKQRMALLLKKYSEFSYQEISQVMGCSVAAVESLIQRARNSLKTALLPYL
jgi:RNA polymerase sigma-70 factor (ECF subfamily)